MNWNRILSALVALIYVIGTGITEGGEKMFEIGLYLLFPLAFIWFGNELGKVTGVSLGRLGGPYITKESPGCLVILLGWIMLILPALLAVIELEV